MAGSADEAERLAIRLAKEDVVRAIGECGDSCKAEKVVEDIGDREIAWKAINELVEEGLLEKRDDALKLTEKGAEVAREILQRHREVERVAATGDPHRIAHSLEHFGEAFGVVKKLLQEKAVPLTGLEVGDAGYVLAVTDPSPRLLARIVGVGLAPGRRIRVVAKLPTVVILEMGASGRAAVVDRDIADKILVALLKR